MVSPPLTEDNESRAPGPSRLRRLSSWFAALSWRNPEPEPPRRLLFLDDDAARAETFLSRNPQAVWIQTVCECLDQLAQTWDEVHLDHDLGGRQYVNVNEVDCGMEVIRWLCKEPRDHLRATRFYVHTHNSIAGLLMVLQMRASGYKAEFRPFGLDLSVILAHNEVRPDNEHGLRARCLHVWRTCVERLRPPRPAEEPPETQPECDAD
jgi:hypothetical protein